MSKTTIILTMLLVQLIATVIWQAMDDRIKLDRAEWRCVHWDSAARDGICFRYVTKEYNQ